MFNLTRTWQTRTIPLTAIGVLTLCEGCVGMKLQPLYKDGDPSPSEMSLDCEWVIGTKPDASDDRLFRCCELPGASPVCWEAEWVEGIPLKGPWPLGDPSAARFYKDNAPRAETAAALRRWLNLYERSTPEESSMNPRGGDYLAPGSAGGCSRPATALRRWRNQLGTGQTTAAELLGIEEAALVAIENCSQLPTPEQAALLEQHAQIPRGWWESGP